MDSEDESPASKDVVRLRCELVETISRAHIALLNSEQTKSKIKFIGRMELAKRIKGSLETDFYPVRIKLFHWKEMGDYLLGIEGKVQVQTRVKLDMKPLRWGHIHAGIVFPGDLKELMKMLENMK